MKKKYKIAKSLIIEKTSDGLLVFNTDSNCFFELNNTATYIFRLIRQGIAPEVISKRMSKVFKISQLVAKQDVNKTITKLLKEKILI